MKPPRFVYHAPPDLGTTLELLAQFNVDAKLLAGGQSLIPMLNMRLVRPGHLIDLQHVGELAGIEERDGGLVVGAMTRQRQVERSALVAQRVPLLAEAIRHVGHLPIRTRGTIGGSIAHADPAAELPGVLLALDGSVRLISVRGERTVPAQDFFVDLLTTAAEPDELLRDVWLPALPAGSGCAWVEIARRHGDYALVGVGAVVTLAEDGHTVAEARLSLISVASRPLRAYHTEALLRGAPATRATWREATQLVRRELDPPGDLHASAGYRRQVAGVLTERALELAAARAQQGGSR
jgi:carbon-monoxide dehydrogenase medium subunit